MTHAPAPSSPYARRRPTLRDDAGWVMVPVIALLAIAIGLGMALLLLVDNQTRASAQQRDMDAAQTLAEGVLTSTANVLAASDPSSGDWTAAGCQKVTGSLKGTADGDTLAARVKRQVRRYFNDADDAQDQLTAYLRAGRTATWTVRVCPTLDPTADTRFTDAVLQRSGTTGTTSDGRKTLWIQAQANIRSAADAPVRSRSVAAKARQGSTEFVPPQDVIDTGSFSTDLAVAGSSLLDDGDLLGGVAGQLLGLGAHPLVAGSADTIGVRCGLLSALQTGLSNVAKLQLCLTGTLGGATSLLNGLNLGGATPLAGLNDLLGIDGRFREFPAWSVAPPGVIDAYRAAAQRGGIYVKGTGNVPAGEAGNSNNHPCLDPDDATTEDTVVFIEKVGNNGEQYCTIQGDRTARILVVARGGVRVTGTFHGVVYAANLQECGPDDTVCSDAERQNAVRREVVKIEPPGQVIGAVWVDGAGGQVGIYPGAMHAATPTALLNVGGTNGICSVPALGPLLNTVGGLLDGVLGLVGTLLSGYEYRPVGGTSATPCSQLKAALGGLGSNQLLNLFGGDGTVTVPVVERRKCNAIGLGNVCLLGRWGPWEVSETVQRPMPDLFGDAGVLSQVSGLLAGTLNGYTAVQRDQDAIDRTRIAYAGRSAALVPGTFRNLPVKSGT